MTASRRAFLAAAGEASGEATSSDLAWLQATLERYAGFGVKASGGAGDNACGAWLEETLDGYGYRCRRQPFQAPFFDARRALIANGGAQAQVIPQAIVVSTGPTAYPRRFAWLNQTLIWRRRSRWSNCPTSDGRRWPILKSPSRWPTPSAEGLSPPF